MFSTLACRAPGCPSPATHRLVLEWSSTPGPTEPAVSTEAQAHAVSCLTLCQAHAGTVTFSLVTDVLAALGAEVVERRPLSETEVSRLAG